MKRVIIESPLSPQTKKLDIPHDTYFSEATGAEHCYLHCKRCENETRRAEELARNNRYLDACIKDSLRRGEAPYASHGFFPRVLDDDDDAEERRLGMDAGFAWGEVGQMRAVYRDLGVSSGMDEGMARAVELDQTIEFRLLGEDWDK